MKIRNGFVSNSSSSSFVVVFPRKPENTKDVMEFMFNGKEGGISVYDLNGLSHSQIAERVFRDIEHSGFKTATKSEIIDRFSGRYNYYIDSYSLMFFNNITKDTLGGAWDEKIGKYCGSNIKNLDKLRNMVIEHEKEQKRINTRQSEIIKDSGINCDIPCAYKGGTNPITKNPYTSQDIEKWEKHHKEIEDYKKNNKEYQKLEKEYEKSFEDYGKQHKLREIIAAEDAEVFLKDYDTQFIFIVEYSDNDEGDVGTTLEHGDIFRNVPHITISNH